MKNIKFSLITSIFALLISGCTVKTQKETTYIDRPEDTNLEFWITQRVNLEDFDNKGCTFLPGWMGADEYLDSRYTADTSSGMATAPDIHVTYLVTGYPDTLDDRAVTNIEITDPNITVYGLTLSSTIEDIRERMTGVADSISSETVGDEEHLTFMIDNCSFVFMDTKITISVPVTNNSGVIY